MNLIEMRLRQIDGINLARAQFGERVGKCEISQRHNKGFQRENEPISDKYSSFARGLKILRVCAKSLTPTPPFDP